MPKVKDKLPTGGFTARAKTDGIDIGQTVGIGQAKASGDARTAAKMRSEARGISSCRLSDVKQESSGNAYDDNNNSI